MNKKAKKVLIWLLDLGINIVIIFALVVVIQKWLIAPFDVSGASMCDTLNNLDGTCVDEYGEKIIINEATYLINDPHRGDIVVFTTPTSDDKYFIKRVIGLPGETVEITNGYVYITKPGETTSTKIEEEYLNIKNKGKTEPLSEDFSVFEVPEDSYFVLGDNRTTSTDSRHCFQTVPTKTCKENTENVFVNKDYIRGRAWVVWWPPSSIRIIDIPLYQIDQTISESLEEK